METAFKTCGRALLVTFVLLVAMLAANQVRATQPESPGSPHEALRHPGHVSQSSGSNGGVRAHRVQARYATLPLRFEPNRGQSDASVKFMARTPGYRLFLTGNGAAFVFRRTLRRQSAARPPAQPWLQMKWLGSEPAPRGEGLGKLASLSNYFLGNNPQRWRTGVPNYARVRFRDVYPGIDLTYYGNPRQLEYDFRVQPGGDPGRLKFRLTRRAGGLPLRLDAHGNLIATIAGRSFRFQRPVAYQDTSRQGRHIRRRVAARYVLEARGHVRIRVG
ncbi:MAG: hypothetical protein ACRD10_07855, partial [Terriglobia bacterium]